MHTGMWLAPGLLAMAAAAATPGEDGWPNAGYPGFDRSIDALVGPTAIDCGFIALRTDKIDTKARQAAYACVQQAMRDKVPFKFGTFRVPIDSFTTEVVARGPDGTLWFVVFDVMPGGDAPQQWNMVCKTVKLDPSSLVLDSRDCKPKSEGKLSAP